MQKLFSCCRMFGTAAIAALALAVLAIPASAGNLYQWRTEEGSFAFADSLTKVPARYRNEMTTRTMESLSGYDRFTPVDRTETTRYERELTARLAALRSQLARPVTAPPPPSMTAANSILLRTGNESAPAIQVTPESGSGPIIMEKVQTRPRDGMVTRHSWVMKQGDKVIAVTIPRSHVSSTSDILIEDTIR